MHNANAAHDASPRPETSSAEMSHLEREIHEQPQALARFLENQLDHREEVRALFRREDVRYLLIASRGSSSNAARYPQYLLGRSQRVPVAFATPSLYTLYAQPPRLEGALVIGISQSGESPDVRAVIEEAARQGRPTIAMTNDPGSALASAAQLVLNLEAGPERSVAATKTLTNSLAAVALVFAISTDDRTALRELQRMPTVIEEQLLLSIADAHQLDPYADIQGGTVVARGINYGTSFEIALKIRELSGLLFEAYSAADLMHGPIAAIGPGWPVIAVAPSGPALESMRTAIQALAKRQARLLVASDARTLLASADKPLRLVEGVPEWLSPFTAVIPGQIVAMSLAQLRGKALDNPEGLSKITRTH